MTAAAASPRPTTSYAWIDERTLAVTFASMASDIEIRIVDPVAGHAAMLERAVAAIDSVATHLTRFAPDSALSRMNRRPDSWHQVPPILAWAVAEAHVAHLATDGLFDPRVLDTLVGWGYDRTFHLVGSEPWPLTMTPAPRQATRRPTWRPDVSRTALVHPGGSPIDLGGVGKGLAVRLAATQLSGAGSAVLVDAGGDQWLGGPGPSGDGWQVGVEDPHGGTQPVLVLTLSDAACATSAITRHRWTSAGRPVHHLVDPRTGGPGGAGLASVTVVDQDPAWAEVWAKSLFLLGPDRIAEAATSNGLGAAWVGCDGALAWSPALAPYVAWSATP